MMASAVTGCGEQTVHACQVLQAAGEFQSQLYDYNDDDMESELQCDV